MTSEPTIRARDVDIFYGQKQALFGVSLDIAPRSVTASRLAPRAFRAFRTGIAAAVLP